MKSYDAFFCYVLDKLAGTCTLRELGHGHAVVKQRKLMALEGQINFNL